MGSGGQPFESQVVRHVEYFGEMLKVRAGLQVDSSRVKLCLCIRLYIYRLCALKAA